MVVAEAPSCRTAHIKPSVATYCHYLICYNFKHIHKRIWHSFMTFKMLSQCLQVGFVAFYSVHLFYVFLINPGEVTYDYYRHWYRTIIIVNEKYYFRQRFQHLYNPNIHDCSSASSSVCCTSIDELHFVLHSEVFIFYFGRQSADDYNRT